MVIECLLFFVFFFLLEVTPVMMRLEFELSLSLLVFYVTCTDVSVIYVTAQMCRWTEEEVVPTVGLPTKTRQTVM